MTKTDNIPTTRQLLTSRGNKASNQYIIDIEGKTIFQSYNSIIAILDYNSNTITIGRDWDYSVTTSKYLYNFLSEFISPINSKKQLGSWLEDGVIESRFTTWNVVYDKEVI